MHEINFIDKSFDQAASRNYSLSIQANSSGLTYCLSDLSSNSYILFRKHRFEEVVLVTDLIRNIGRVLETDETLSLPFHKIRFLAYTQQSTLIPRDFFDSGKMREYLMFNHAGDIDKALFNNLISPPGIFNVFSLPDELVSLITVHFKKVEFMNQTTPFLRHIANLPESFMKKAVYLGLNQEFFDIACTGDGKLLLYNTFQYNGENDLLYYVLFVCKKVGFDPAQIPLMISGELSSRSSFLDTLKQFIPETRCDEAVCIPALTSGLKQLGTSRFLNLLNIQMCASSAEYIRAEK